VDCGAGNRYQECPALKRKNRNLRRSVYRLKKRI
jgi:hypothetical protein